MRLCSSGNMLWVLKTMRVMIHLKISFPILATFGIGYAANPDPDCHPNPHAQQDMAEVRQRGDIRHLPDALEDRLVDLAGRPKGY